MDIEMELIEKLQDYVQKKSVDELKSIKPISLGQALGIKDFQVKKLIDYLYDKGALIYKYNIKCPECGEEHTIYQNEIRKSKKVCDECGEAIYFDRTFEKAKLLVVLDKNEILKLKKRINFKEESIGKIINIGELKSVIQNGNINRIKEEKMEIFIGSSTQAVDIIDQIALTIEEKGFEPLPWNSRGKGVFTASKFTLENLINTAERVKGAVFIFNSDDEIWYSSDNLKVKKTRDNVLFEYGLFVGKNGRNNVVFICKNSPKIASDLNGVTYIDADKGEYSVKIELKEWLDSLK